jgi:proteasome activator subunit 4
VPSDDEIAFVLDILDHVITPALDKVEALIETTAKWDNVDRNDFCRWDCISTSPWTLVI